MQFVRYPPLLFVEAKKIVCLFAAVYIFCASSFSQQDRNSKKFPPEQPFPEINVNLSEHLNIFNEKNGPFIYSISLCADVPNNKIPLQVAYHQQTGHVFIILQKISLSNDTLCRVFGFYPRRGLPTLLFKTIKSVIRDNSLREYDVAISRQISAEQFDTVLAKAKTWALRKYHINKYNCYDYALDLFNIGAGQNALPLNHVRFPFVFGKGGSPCSVYSSLKEIYASGKSPAGHIKFGEMKAPISTGRLK